MSYYNDTLIPFWQYVEWLGLDGWRVAGVNRGGSDVNVYGKPVTYDDNCECFLEFNASHTSRVELKESLLKAEEFFIFETNLFPAPKQIIDEEHQVENGWLINPLKSGHYNNLKSFRPFKPCEVRKFGLFELNKYDSVNVVKVDGNDEILETMSVTFDVPLEVDLSSIRLFFDENECSYCGYMTEFEDEKISYNTHLCEIRPFCDIVEGSSLIEGMKQVTITIHAYILVKPSLQTNQTKCLENVPETYVDSLDIYIEEKLECQDGYFLCHESGCGNVPCSTSEMNLCISEKLIYKEKWFVPKPVQAETIDGDCSFTESCVKCNPERVVVNYISGKKILIDKRVDWNCLDVISKLALFLQDCIKQNCKCDVCLNKKIEHYLSIPKEVIRDNNELGAYGDEYQLLISKYALEYADGLVPTRGLVEAMRVLKKIRCEFIEGEYV